MTDDTRQTQYNELIDLIALVAANVEDIGDRLKVVASNLEEQGEAIQRHEAQMESLIAKLDQSIWSRSEEIKITLSQCEKMHRKIIRWGRFFAAGVATTGAVAVAYAMSTG